MFRITITFSNQEFLGIISMMLFVTPFIIKNYRLSSITEYFNLIIDVIH